MEAALSAGVSRIVYTSSVAALGIPGDGTPGDEETPARLTLALRIANRGDAPAQLGALHRGRQSAGQ